MRLAPAAATKAVTYTALFDVDNQDAELLPQMTAQVVFVTGSAQQALTVPLTALHEKDQQSQSVRC
jgi:macrolide-specific efflux system membrane fusion protein